MALTLPPKPLPTITKSNTSDAMDAGFGDDTKSSLLRSAWPGKPRASQRAPWSASDRANGLQRAGYRDPVEGSQIAFGHLFDPGATDLFQRLTARRAGLGNDVG